MGPCLRTVAVRDAFLNFLFASDFSDLNGCCWCCDVVCGENVGSVVEGAYCGG